MQDLNITLVQTKQFWEDKTANLSYFEEKLKSIKTGTDIIILPEMFHTSFSMNAKNLAETMGGIGVKWLTNQASKNQAAIIASLIIKEDGKYYNRMVFVSPDGRINQYDKRKLFTLANEHKHYSAGKSNTIVKYKGWKILLQICYDLRFPELCRNEINQANQPDYDIVVYVANWPKKRSTHWSNLLKARAIENQCYVVGVNRVGEDANGLDYSGNSMIVDALGEELVHLVDDEAVISKKITFQSLKTIREKLPFLKDK